MKALILVFTLSIFSMSLHAQSQVVTGMTLAEFKKVYPCFDDKKAFRISQTFRQADGMGGVKGQWLFQFKDDTLTSAVFESERGLVWQFNNMPSMVKVSCDTFLLMTHAIREELNSKYGIPVTQFERKPMLTGTDADYYKRNLARYQWNTDQFCVVLDFSFYGQDTSLHDYFPVNSKLQTYYYMISVSFVSPVAVSSVKNKELFTGKMDIASFADAFPGIFPHGIERKAEFSVEKKQYGLDGSWHYTLENGHVSSVYYSSYSKDDQLTEAFFNLYLQAALDWTKEISARYGAPAERNEGRMKFADPSKEHHWGYDVFKASWKLPDRQLIVRFDFFGGKGEYAFVLEYGDRKIAE